LAYISARAINPVFHDVLPPLDFTVFVESLLLIRP
jgi:hypothetical protein